MQKFLAVFSLAFVFSLISSASFADSAYKVDGASQIKIDVYHPTKHVKAYNKAGSVQGNVTIKGSLIPGKAVDVAGSVQIAVGSLESGNGRRDRYMRSVLGGAESIIRFVPKSLTMKTMNAKGGSGELVGSFTINNNTHPVTFQASFEGDILKGEKVVVQIKTHVLCSTYKIKRPALLWIPIKDKVDLAMTLRFAR
ncbi:YceI family protein [Myxococcota bacterium]|nr:YceI family protein [Myxococcota bacterium]